MIIIIEGKLMKVMIWLSINLAENGLLEIVDLLKLQIV